MAERRYFSFKNIIGDNQTKIPTGRLTGHPPKGSATKVSDELKAQGLGEEQIEYTKGQNKKYTWLKMRDESQLQVLELVCVKPIVSDSNANTVLNYNPEPLLEQNIDHD